MAAQLPQGGDGGEEQARHRPNDPTDLPPHGDQTKAQVEDRGQRPVEASHVKKPSAARLILQRVELQQNIAAFHQGAVFHKEKRRDGRQNEKQTDAK